MSCVGYLQQIKRFIFTMKYNRDTGTLTAFANRRINFLFDFEREVSGGEEEVGGAACEQTLKSQAGIINLLDIFLCESNPERRQWLYCVPSWVVGWAGPDLAGRWDDTTAVSVTQLSSPSSLHLHLQNQQLQPAASTLLQLQAWTSWDTINETGHFRLGYKVENKFMHKYKYVVLVA